MRSFLDKYFGGGSSQEFFEHFDLDAITWPVCHEPNLALGDSFDPLQGEPGFLEARRIWSDRWKTYADDLSTPGSQATRYRFVTPQGTLTMVTESNEQTTWVVEYPVKEKKDIDLIGAYVTHPLCDVEAVNAVADEYGARGLVRTHIPCFDVFGQPGTWQDACCLYGTEELILATYDDPGWVHELLGILSRRKQTYIRSMAGARLRPGGTGRRLRVHNRHLSPHLR